MALADRFLKEARIGEKVDLVAGPKELVGTIVALDAETVSVKKIDGKTAIIDLSTVTYFEMQDDEEEVEVVPIKPVAPVQEVVQISATVEKEEVVDNEPKANIGVLEAIDIVVDNIVKSAEQYPEENAFEFAVIRRDMDAVRGFAEEKEPLVLWGYSEELIERIDKISKLENLARGVDDYSIACRLDSFQENWNGTAEKYYKKTLGNTAAGESQRTKSARKLQLYYVHEKKYEDYVRLIENYPDLVDLSRGVFYAFYGTALTALGKDAKEVLYRIPITFTQQADYIYLFHYLAEAPDNYLAGNATKKLLNEYKFLRASELALEYSLNNKERADFNRLRKEMFGALYPTYTISQLADLLNIGYSVEETEQVLADSLEEGEESNYVQQARPVENVVADLLRDSYFGIIRAIEFLNRTENSTDILSEQLEQIENNAEEDWQIAVEEKNESRMHYLIALYEICNISEDKLLKIKSVLRNDDDSELCKALEHYDAKKVKAILADTNGLKHIGYSEKEIEKFAKIMENGAFPVGMADYEIASRLSTWGFAKQAVKYYANVAKNPQMEKQKNAINQLVSYATHVKDIELFETYYELLDNKQKKNDVYLKFLKECQYYHGEYKELYDSYIANKTITHPYVIYGAMRYKENQNVRDELIEKACQLPIFNYGVWKTFLEEVIADNLEEYRSILRKLLEEYTIKCASRMDELYEIIALDPQFAGEVTEELILYAMEEQSPLALVLVLCANNPDISQETKDKVLERLVEKLNYSVEDMEYRQAYEIASVAQRFFVDNEDLKSIVRISSNGMDVYNMLPSGHDNYARGKRLLMLGEDVDRAFSCFEREITSAEDVSTIALCGIELLKGLLEAGRYAEVIKWGYIIIIEKEIVEYTSLALDINHAFEKLEDKNGREDFIEQLVKKADASLEESQYKLAVELIRLIEIFDKGNEFVIRYAELLDKMKDENINLDKDTFIGKANILRYVKQDEAQYITFIKNGFRDGEIEANGKNAAAVMLLEAIITGDKIAENMDFIDEISSYGIVISEHIVDMLYSIVVANKNMDSAIAFFTNLYNLAEGEKRLPILIRLEKIYENALRNGCAFDTTHAVEQMLAYTQQNSSLQARLCYIWILAYAGNTYEAAELLSLIPEDASMGEEHSAILEIIVEKYFNGFKPDLFVNFANLVRENTLLRFVEHCRLYKDFITYSHEEEKIHAELIKNSSYKVDISSEIAKSAIIKTIYEMPTRYKFWYLYYLCVKNSGDVELVYCLNTILAILNNDVTSDVAEKQVAYYLKSNSEIAQKYGAYKLYNKLYRLYLLKAYQKNTSVINQITTFSMDRKFFASHPEIRKKLAEDYIHLLKLLDDRDDYIYVKSAMFIATNNKCEKYFYELFKKDLLYREPVICIKMCLEMIVSNSSKELVRTILNDLNEVSPDYSGVVSVLTSNSENIVVLCRLLKDYPELPKSEHIADVLKNFKKNEPKQIEILEELESCYSDALVVKKRLLTLYRNAKNRAYYEKMYQCAIYIMKSVTSEEELYEWCRLAALLAVAVGKKNRTTDILSIYDKQSLDLKYEKELAEFCGLCDYIADISDEKINKVLDALISDNWMEVFVENGAGFIASIPNVRALIDFSKTSFVKTALLYMTILGQAQREEELAQFKSDIDSIMFVVFNKSLLDIMDQLLQMEGSEQNAIIDLIDLKEKANPFASIPDDENIIKTLFRIWDIVYGELSLSEFLKTQKRGAKGYDLLCRKAIGYYENRDLLRTYTIALYGEKKYADIVCLKEEFYWAIEDLNFATYFAVALLRQGDSIALDYIARMMGERYVNVVLLLKKQMLAEEIQKICMFNPAKREITNLITALVENPTEAHLVEIENKHSNENAIALLKLMYSRTDNTDLQIRLVEKYGEAITENEYIVLWKKALSTTQKGYYLDGDNAETAKKAMSIKECKFVNEAMKEISVEEYQLGVPRGEYKRLLDVYEGLGSDVRENAEYKKELLTKLAYISSRTGDIVGYHNSVERLGIAIYYCNIEIDMNKAREVLFETVMIMSEKTRRANVEFVRRTVCDMLGRYESVDEIVATREGIVRTLNHLLTISTAKEFTMFFIKMREITDKITEISKTADISMRSSNFQRLSGTLRTYVAKFQNSQIWGPVYAKWYRLIQSEIKKLSRGAVIELEVETTQCSPRGKICCVIKNLGKKPAENIIVKAIFEDAVRCKDNEKEIKILYGGDTSVFAFSIRCRDEGVQNYKIELSYEIAQNVEQVDYSHEIRIVKENDYEHIGNLYSVAPVTNNAEFYGREREKEEILSFLNDIKYNTSMVMHGLKRVGKTSMLRYIERTMRDSDIYIPVYKSAQGISEQNAIGQMFVETIIDELENLGLADDKCRSYLEYNYNSNPEQLYDFYTYLQKAEILGKKRILFMADEIEEIFDMVDEEIINRRFYKVLRVILQELTSIRFIFCGADHLTDILYNHALADVFEITKRVTISRLDEDSMCRMIVEPATDKLSYTECAIERIWYYTKGHTFYSKHICSKVIDILNDESRATAFAYDIDVAVKQVMRVTEYFIYLSRFFNENDKQLIRLMCENIKFSRDRVSLDILEDEYVGRGLSDSLTALEFKDILEKTEGYDTDFYQFSIEMFRLWYSKAEYVTEAREE